VDPLPYRELSLSNPERARDSAWQAHHGESAASPADVERG